MSCGGTSAPRRNVEVGGLAVRWAQSRGEWPGSRRTFLEGRVDGERVEVEREEVGGAREREGGARRVAAVDGGGRRVGGARRVGVGVGGAGLGLGSGFRFAFGLGRGGGGGGIMDFDEGGDMARGDEGLDSVSCVVFAVGPFFRSSLGAGSFSLPPSSSVNVGTSDLLSSSLSSFAIGDPAPVLSGLCFPIHADSADNRYLYMTTETETIRTPSPNSTMATPSPLTSHLRCR